MYRLLAALPKDRRLYGRLTLLSPGGSVLFHVVCLGKADNRRAELEGNPNRSPVLPYGDTPAGTYAAARVRRFDPPHKRLGAYAIPLIGIGGQALEAMRDGGDEKPPRTELYIHGGRGNEKLIVTYGCLRVSDDDMAKLVAKIGFELIDSIVIEEKAVELA